MILLAVTTSGASQQDTYKALHNNAAIKQEGGIPGQSLIHPCILSVAHMKASLLVVSKGSG